MLIDFFFFFKWNFYPQVFLKECIYGEKDKKVIRYITDGLEISFDDFEEENSNESDGILQKD